MGFFKVVVRRYSPGSSWVSLSGKKVFTRQLVGFFKVVVRRYSPGSSWGSLR